MTFLERVHHEPDRCWVDVILFNGTFDDEARVTFVWRIMASVVWTIACLGSIDVENRRNRVDVRIFLSSFLLGSPNSNEISSHLLDWKWR